MSNSQTEPMTDDARRTAIRKLVKKWRRQESEALELAEQRENAGQDATATRLVAAVNASHADELAALDAGPVSAPVEPLKDELCRHLDTLTITGDTIGDIRRSLFFPWDSAWNVLVRDETAAREVSRASSAGAAPQGCYGKKTGDSVPSETERKA